jgi:hypothetical protein
MPFRYLQGQTLPSAGRGEGDRSSGGLAQTLQDIVHRFRQFRVVMGTFPACIDPSVHIVYAVIELGEVAIPPFLTGCIRRTYAAIFSFCAGVMPPMPMFGRSLL